MPYRPLRPAVPRRPAIPHRPAVLLALAVLLASAAPLAPAGASTAIPLFDPAAASVAGATPGSPASREPGSVSVRLNRASFDALRRSERASVVLPTADGERTLALARAEVLRPGATVTVTDDHGARPFSPDIVCLRGTVAGEPGSFAVIVLGPRGVTGLVESRGERWGLVPGSGGLHQVRREAPEPGAAPRCGMGSNIEPVPGAKPLPRADEILGPAGDVRYVCDLAVDCDYEWTATRFSGDLSSATQHVLTLMAVVSLIYERDLGTSIQVGSLNLWTTSSDPYTQPSAQNQLFEFRNWWLLNRSGVPRTIAHLVSGRNLNGGWSFIDVLCSDPTVGFGFGVTSVEASSTLPNNITSRDVWLLAHEIGHEFGSQHTQSCFWQDNGYAPAGALLDSCYAAEGGCYAGPTGIVPRDKGTIMSYCDQLSGGSPSNDRLAFHPACIALMRQRVEASCMPPAAPQPAFQLTASALGDAAHLEWEPGTSVGTITFEVYRSRHQLDLAPTLLGTTAETHWDDPVPWGTFYYRVRMLVDGVPATDAGEVEFRRCPMAQTDVRSGLDHPFGIASGDFNADGITDLVVSHNTASQVAVLLGNGSGGIGDGTFAPPVTYASGTAPAGVVTGDFNDDGITDMAVACVSTNNVMVRLGNGAGGVGDGTFGPSAFYATSFGATAIVTGDFNEDGITDLAVVNTGNASMTPLLGQGADGVGNGTFIAGTTLSSQGTGLKDLVAGDINGDGITDLLILRNAGFRTLLGNGSAGKGNGAFLVGNNYAAGSFGAAIAAGDLNGDEILDVAVVNNATVTLSPMLAILLGNGSGGAGNGTFAARVEYPTGPTAQSVAIADWTGDGIADVAVGVNGPTNGVLLYPGLGNGQLAGAIRLDTWTPVRSLLPGDFDSDGVTDLVTSNNAANTLSTIRTDCAPELTAGATVTSPNGGEVWTIPSERTITWVRDPGCPSVNVDLSRDGGATWERVASNVHRNSYSWTATPPFSNQARIRVSNAFVPGAADASDATFVLIPPELLDVGAAGAPVALAIRRVMPNPVHGDMTVTLALPDAGPATLELFDLGGRRIRVERVVAGAPGERRVAWTDLRLAAGIYLLRLARGPANVTSKIAVVE